MREVEEPGGEAGEEKVCGFGGAAREEELEELSEGEEEEDGEGGEAEGESGGEPEPDGSAVEEEFIG